MKIDLEAIGLTQEEVQQRVIERICSNLLTGESYDEDGTPFADDSELAKKLTAAVRKQVDDTINLLATKHVLPNVAQYIESLTMQATNQWGEKTGKKTTFIEYLAQRAEAYMQEQVDYNGKSKAESRDGYSWKGTQTRITALVNEHLHYSIKTAMEYALKDANSKIAGGIMEAVKIKLNEVAALLRVEVKTGR